MRMKKGKISTFIFSLLPGAGHMYMGFMKMGISFMSAFFFVIFIAGWLDIGPLLFVLPLIWFYSFFDCINKRYSSDEEFLNLEDNYLFSLDKLLKVDQKVFTKQRLFVGIVCLFLGLYLIWNNVMNTLWGHIPNEVYEMLSDVTRTAPRIIIGIAIIVAGIKLIKGKKREMDKDV
ncbi:hypothetical protein [Clostridium ljungdahlii]|uniref:TM2 domain protein n=1 Tax=Clostridium ljungdahlii TaxID=1538 RepID=A0A168NSC3_9CLOT|nr:hypothetical protein [Clostridium ljungdahlii]OAA86840.1 hypothetical protein WY13_02234 [Clostridium ljungdahlii]